MGATHTLDLIALQLFDHTYRVEHRNVSIPRGFAAQRPPPFLRSAYPRIREVEQRTARRVESASSLSATSSSTVSGAGGGNAWTEWEWQLSFLDRLERARLAFGAKPDEEADGATVRDDLEARWTSRSRGGLSSGLPILTTPPVAAEEVDILREALPDAQLVCGALDAVLLDYAPYARWIVMERPLPQLCTATGDGAAKSFSSSSCCCSPSSSVPPSPCTMTKGSTTVRLPFPGVPPMPTSAGQPSGVPSRRTTFRFTSAPAPLRSEPPPPPPVRRHCTELQYQLLQRGLPADTDVRKGCFSVLPGVFSSLGLGETVGDSTDRPLLPEGETIEEFSD